MNRRRLLLCLNNLHGPLILGVSPIGGWQHFACLPKMPSREMMSEDFTEREKAVQ